MDAYIRLARLGVYLLLVILDDSWVTPHAATPLPSSDVASHIIPVFVLPLSVSGIRIRCLHPQTRGETHDLRVHISISDLAQIPSLTTKLLGLSCLILSLAVVNFVPPLIRRCTISDNSTTPTTTIPPPLTALTTSASSPLTLASTNPPWAKLAIDVLTWSRDIVLEELNNLRDAIDTCSIVFLLTSSEPALVQFHSPAWLIHWSLFVYFDRQQGRLLLLETFLSPTYLNTIQTSCTQISRYLTVASILSPKSSSAAPAA
ncbi:Eukaryotic translation initiation factor 3 subunit E [Hypsizygus marmoreus]|uniref:Eukaryotic translation initiation factor 3 subunit E n=1 Tax=Hypsizygus marmoreus TaxID=39966 RepID=A0A369K796_HYPMA|nr:Eukaryotic translation initiation factor 3 subunit E [Hypsizygus marmoreus]